MDLVAEGRLAEVFAYGPGTVVKLDRPGWNGLSDHEAGVLRLAAAQGLPVPRVHEVVTIDGRTGVVLDRIDGGTLESVLAVEVGEQEVLDLARRFTELQQVINGARIEALPDLVPRLADELGRSGLPPTTVAELQSTLHALDDGARGVCHFDFHPDNVLVGPDGWVVIDWVTAASGPPMADVARTLVLRGQHTVPPMYEFMQAVRRHSLEQRHIDEATADGWIKVVAGARLAEGFDGAYASWLVEVAEGRLRLFV